MQILTCTDKRTYIAVRKLEVNIQNTCKFAKFERVQLLINNLASLRQAVLVCVTRFYNINITYFELY